MNEMVDGDPGEGWTDAPLTGAVRPEQVRVGVGLVIASAVVWLPVAGLVQRASGPGLEGLLLILCVVFAVRSLKGRHKARIGTTVSVALLFLLLGGATVAGFTDPDLLYGTEYALLGVVAAGCSVAGTALLYAPPSAAYFRARREQGPAEGQPR